MDYRKKLTIGSLLVITLLSVLYYIPVTNIRQILIENPTAQLILIEGLAGNRIELI